MTTKYILKGETIMKYRVRFTDYRKDFPTYFYTKREAVAFQAERGGIIQRKIGGNWFDY